MHNPTRADHPAKWKDVELAVYQLELSGNGSYHYQGYVEFSKAKSLTEMKAFHTGMYCKAAYGSREANVKYCTKEATRVADVDGYFDSLE